MRSGILVGVACGALGAPASGGSPAFEPLVSGFEAPCSAEVNVPPGFIGGGGSGQPRQCDWSASISAPLSTSSPVISTIAPATGAQHLRFQHDPGQATGAIDLAADPGSRNWAFSETIVPAPPLGPVTLSFRIRISGRNGENAFIIQPQTPSGGELSTVMIFYPNGTIAVGDDNGNCDDPFFATIPTGDAWTPGVYVPAAICLDPIADRIRYYYGGFQIYSTGAGEGGTGGPLGCGVFAGERIEQVLIRYEGNFDDGTILDIDDVRIEPGCHSGPPDCSADITGDGSVGFADLLALFAAWGICGERCPQDLNGNGEVDFADVLLVVGGWGFCR